jgi:carboxymethylenebutenolidase
MKAWGEGPSPFELTEHIVCPLLGLFGADDTNPSPDDVARIDARLTERGVAHEFHVYEGAGHAFLNFSNPQRHRPEQAADAWQKLLGFLRRHVG